MGVTESSLFVRDGVVYVGSRDLHIYAIDAATGTMLWRHKTGAEIRAAPTVADGIVFVGSDDGNLYALDAETGTTLWTYESSGLVRVSPVVADGMVYIGLINRGSPASVIALNATDGDLAWRRDETEVESASSLVVADGVLYYGSDDGNVNALDSSTGELLWSYRADQDVYTPPQPAIYNGTVYVHWGELVFALDNSNGSLQWQYEKDGLGTSIWAAFESFFSSAPIGVVDGVAYVSSADGHIYGLDAETGERLWRYQWGEEGLFSPVTISGGIMYTASNDGLIFALSASAASRYRDEPPWVYSTGGRVYSSPAVSGGAVYVVAHGGDLYALNAYDGDLLWQYEFAGKGTMRPVATEGVVLAVSDDGSLHAVEASAGSLLWRFEDGDTPAGASPAVAGGVVYAGLEGIYALELSTGNVLWKHETGARVESHTHH